MTSRLRHSLLFVLTAAALALTVAGCARTSRTRTRPVSIDARPTPPQPAATPAATTQAARTPAAPPPAKAAPAARPRFEADTLAARAAFTRCSGRRLLPEQESTLDSVRRLLFDARTAALRGDSAHAQSLGREALQLARSLNCP